MCHFVCVRLGTILRRSTMRILWESDISKWQKCWRIFQRTLYLHLDLWDHLRMASVSISMMRLNVCMNRWFVICIVELHSLKIPALRKKIITVKIIYLEISQLWSLLKNLLAGIANENILATCNHLLQIHSSCISMGSCITISYNYTVVALSWAAV